MIEPYALEPELVATWGRPSEFRFIRDKFGLGSPRAMLELPSFTKWRRTVVKAAEELQLTDLDKTRLTEVLKLLEDHKCRRNDSQYDGKQTWLPNAEAEHNRRTYGGIIATSNPRQHPAVITGDHLGLPHPRWDRVTGVTPRRNAAELAKVLAGLLMNAREVHLVDPHFGPENSRHRAVLRAMLETLADADPAVKVTLYCSGAGKSSRDFFEAEAEKMAAILPLGLQVNFVRLKANRERLHNRYVLSNLGGVTLGVGLDQGAADIPEQTDDISLMSRNQYILRWEQYVKLLHGAFDVVDNPSSITGKRGNGRARR